MSNEELRFVRAFSPEVIPKYLVEQVKDRDYSIEDFYKYQMINCLIDTEKGQTLNPLNHLYAMADDENTVKGFLWMSIDTLSKDLVINIYSIDKDYWNKGKAVKILAEFVKELMEKHKIKRCFWITKYPKHSERYGFKKSKNVLMEYCHGQDDDGLNGAQEKCKHADTRAAKRA